MLPTTFEEITARYPAASLGMDAEFPNALRDSIDLLPPSGRQRGEAWLDPRERPEVGSSHPENSLGLCVDTSSVVWRMF